MTAAHVLPALIVATLLTACAAPSPVGLAELMDKRAERALLRGIRAYDDGDYAASEAALRRALAAGLESRRDRATAHKLLAFLTCTSNRIDTCEAEFRAARAADPRFHLTPAERGHPMWAPVYERSRSTKAAAN